MTSPLAAVTPPVPLAMKQFPPDELGASNGPAVRLRVQVLLPTCVPSAEPLAVAVQPATRAETPQVPVVIPLPRTSQSSITAAADASPAARTRPSPTTSRASIDFRQSDFMAFPFLSAWWSKKGTQGSLQRDYGF